MIPVTLDTGALIAMERRRESGVMLLRAAREHRVRLVTITPVITEWWRGRSDVRDQIKRALSVVPFPLDAAEAAGVAFGALSARRPGLAVDVMVTAFAALAGGSVVYTGDVDDLTAIADQCFPAVRVLGV